MEIITITIDERDGEQLVGMYHSSAVTPAVGVQACELVLRVFRERVIEAEVERRLGERAAGDGA